MSPRPESADHLRPQSNRRGFTLIELLVVISIILVVVSMTVSSFRGGNTAASAKGAAGIAAGLFNSARTEAIMRQTSTRVVIDTTDNPTHPEYKYHRFTVVYAATNTTTSLPDWTLPPLQASKWTILPSGIFYNSVFSKSHGQMSNVTFAGTGSVTTGYDYFEFGPTGLSIPSTGTAAPYKFIVSPGNVVNGVFTEQGTTLDYGFQVNKMGRISFYDNPTDAQSSTY